MSSARQLTSGSWQVAGHLVTLSPHHLVTTVSLIAFAIFLTTLQLNINGSSDPYATDVGEIQNALPRWGTIHFNGYPLYTVIGSTFVTLLRFLGISPAAGASLYSAIWGAASVALLAGLMLALSLPPLAAAVGALLYALSTSIWIDASVAEVHTMSMALTFAALIAAVRFGRRGQPSDLYWLAFLAGQAIAHQRAFALFGPALLILTYHRWRLIAQKLPLVAGLTLLGPLTYLYLPLRAWMGADWIWDAPATWDRFWQLVFYTRTDLVEVPATLAGWLERVAGFIRLLAFDWPLPLLVLGLASLFLPVRSTTWRERLALTISWLLHIPVSVIVWEGYVSDALLAVKLPVIAVASVGLACLTGWLYQQRPILGRLSITAWLLLAIFLYADHRPAILAITRHPGASETIALAERIEPVEDGRPLTLMALWGNDYWQLAYAQAYQHKFPHLNLVDHNANFAVILARGDHLYTLSRTFYQRPVSWWEERLGRVYLSSVAPGIVEIATAPDIDPVQEPLLALDNGINVRDADLTWLDNSTLLLALAWQARQAPAADASVAVHLVAQDPPAGPNDILAQADSAHPVDGWYPTSRWATGELVHDHILLAVPPGAGPVAVRLAMYRLGEDGQFQNTAWLSLQIPPRSKE